MRTTAAVLRGTAESDDLAAEAPARLEGITVAEPTGEEVLIEIEAASLCHTDVAIARGELTRPRPIVMGHEGAGTVRAVGEDVTSVEPGDSVVCGRTTCGRCGHCRAGEGQHCVERSPAHSEGRLRTGAVRFADDEGPIHHTNSVASFTEHTVVTEEVAIPVPEALPAERATLLGCGVFTGAGAAMNTADIEAGSSTVVFGTGGVGLSTVQGARIRGASEIIAVDVVPEKLGVAEAVGATHTVDSSAVDPVEAIREVVPGGVDYAFDAVGHEAVVEQCVDSLCPTGEAVLVGVAPEGKRSLDLDLQDLVTTEKSVVGSFNGSYTLPVAIPKLADLALSGALDLDPMVSKTRPLAEVNEAMGELETGTGIRQVLLP